MYILYIQHSILREFQIINLDITAPYCLISFHLPMVRQGRTIEPLHHLLMVGVGAVVGDEAARVGKVG